MAQAKFILKKNCKVQKVRLQAQLDSASKQCHQDFCLPCYSVCICIGFSLGFLVSSKVTARIPAFHALRTNLMGKTSTLKPAAPTKMSLKVIGPAQP